MIKVAVLTSVRLVFDSRVFHKQCKSLARAGFHVTYIVPHTKDEVVDGVRIKAIRKPTNRTERLTRVIWQVYREAIAVNADLYHFHDAELILVALLLRARGKKVVYDIHDDAPGGLLTKFYIPRPLRTGLAWLAERIENMACQYLSGITLALPGLVDKYSRLNANTVAVYNFPMLHEMPSPAETTWDQRLCAIAYLGALSEERKIFALIEALNLLPSALGAVLKWGGLFIPGSLREAVLSMPGWRSVEALGYLNRPGVAKVLKESKLGIVVAEREPRFFHCFPVKLFEYMAAAIPVIATNFPLWQNIVDSAGCGLVVDSDKPQEIAMAIEYLLTHPAEAEAMGRRGREAIEKQYRWESEEKKMIRFFADLTGAKIDPLKF